MFLKSSSPQVIPLAIGLLVGGLGATLFHASRPGDPGSERERADQLSDQLKEARRQISLLESSGRRLDRAPLADGLRDLAGNLSQGKTVSPEDVLRRVQPMLRELGPLLARLRAKQFEMLVEGGVGDLSQRYGLDETQTAQLRKLLKNRAEEDAQSWSRLVGSTPSLEEMVKQTRETSISSAVGEIMPQFLDGEKLSQFQTEQAEQKAWQVKRDANGKTEQINRAVQLDPDQRRQVYGIMARSSSSYDPSLDVPGADAGSGTGMDAALKVLRPDQQKAYEESRQLRQNSAAARMAELGLSLPDDWEQMSH